MINMVKNGNFLNIYELSNVHFELIFASKERGFLR